MTTDRLTSKERMSLLYSGEPIDRVPFLSSATMYAGRIKEQTSYEFYFDVEKSYEAQDQVIQIHESDDRPCFDLPNGDVLDFGGELLMDGNKPVIIPAVSCPIHTVKEAIDYKLPNETQWQFLKKKIEFTNYALKRGDKGVGISAGSPFTTAGSMVDMSLLLQWTLEEPELVHKLLEQACEYLLRSADILIEAYGIENCSVSSNFPLESNDLISPSMFQEFALPYILKMHNSLLKKGVKNFSIHLCGNQIHNLPFFRELHLPEKSFISVDEKNPLSTVAKTLGKEHIYAGNVPSGMIAAGSPQEVYNCAATIIEAMKYNQGGFVLMPSCDLPINAKPANLHAMLSACRDFGCYE